ncbi:MAG: NifB/NifX family molybdenum-iron cluster-binding protein, partial [Bacillota bacterium]
MKIAIASENGVVSNHFGHCEGFKVYQIENKEIITEDFIANPGHKPGFLPVFLNDKDIKVIISGGMGAKAIELFNQNDIEVIVGASGNVKEVLKKYLQGELKSSGSVCHDHMHHGD